MENASLQVTQRLPIQPLGLELWQKQMQQKPSFTNKLSKKLQTKINSLLPDKVHAALTTAIKQMTRAILFGAGVATQKADPSIPWQTQEPMILEKIRKYQTTAATEGAITGAGGILMGFADFPLWLSIKMKMLFDIASSYGFDTKDYKERVYILHIFQLTFSSQQHRNKIYALMENWEVEKQRLPADINEFDWQSFQQEYRDYIDLAKLLQLVPGIGAIVGAYVNNKLTKKLGLYAINAYRMRLTTINTKHVVIE